VRKHTNIIIFIVCSLILSVFVRYDQITREIGCDEQTYILTLQTVEIWREHGLFASRFTPMWTYKNEGDKFFAYYKRLEDKSGNNYYVSFPPLAFWFAYIAMLPFDIENGKLVLQILNLFIHFLSAFLVLLIVSSAFDNLFLKKIPFEAGIAFLVYLFLPVNLYLHTHIFFPEMLSQLFFLAIVYYIIYIYKFPEKAERLIYPLCLLLFGFVLTEWIALFFSVVLLALFIFRRNRFGKLIKPLFISISAALLLTFIIYSSIDGISSLAKAMGMRFLERTGFFGEKYSSMGVTIFHSASLKIMFANIHKALWGWGYIIILSGMTALIFSKKLFLSALRKQKHLILITSMPVLLYMLVLFNANALHFLLMARLSIPLVFLAAITANTLNNSTFQRTSVSLIMIIGLLLSVHYYRSHLTFNVSNHEACKLAAHIRTKADNLSSVFVMSNLACGEFEKYLTFKSKRNLIRVENMAEADSLSKLLNKKNAIVFIHENGNDLISCIPIGNP